VIGDGWVIVFVAAVDSIDVQGIKLETLDARSWRRRSRSTRDCKSVLFHVCVLRFFVEELGACGRGMQRPGMRVKRLW
jgi:hypothetical protein